MKFVIKLFPEITIKSKPVRQRFVRQLKQNINEVLKREYQDVSVVGFWDKVEVRVADDCPEKAARIAETLQRIPGIANILRVQNYQIDDINNRFDHIVELTLKALGPQLKDKTFVVRVKRVGNHTFTSHELEQYAGGGLLHGSEAKGVDLHNPELTVRLEIRNDQLYIIEERYEGLGGFPLGTLDSVLSLMSGGFDSTVASYLTIKRGLKTHFCFFNLGGSAHEIGVKQVSLYLWERYGVSHRVKFVTVPFEEVVSEILKSVHHSQMGVVLKRMMLRAASQIAKDMNIQALVKGDSVAQVSSQTLTNLCVVDSVTDTLVLRPLITMDKLDIIRLSRKIGTEDFAKNMPEYCGVISDRPTTCAKKERIAEEEAKFDFTVLDKAIANRTTIKIDQVMKSSLSLADVKITAVPEMQDIVIDIRHPDEREKAPLTLTNNKIETIAFYELISNLDRLDSSKSYLLYCEKGTMSQLHASHLKGMGYAHIGVYQP